LRLIFGGQKVLEDDDSGEEDEERVRRKVLSVAQDIVYCTSGGKKWTPKHVCTLHQATRSKDLVHLFHEAGHCLSYEQVMQVDTSLAEFTLTTLDGEIGAVIPPNMVENNFIHYTHVTISTFWTKLSTGKILYMLRKWLPGSGVEHLSINPDNALKRLQPSTKCP